MIMIKFSKNFISFKKKNKTLEVFIPPRLIPKLEAKSIAYFCNFFEIFSNALSTLNFIAILVQCSSKAISS